MRPSFIGACINGLLMTVVIIYTIYYWSTLGNYEQIVLMSLIAILMGIHAFLHHIEEIYYNFNPLEGKWKYDELRKQ